MTQNYFLTLHIIIYLKIICNHVKKIKIYFFVKLGIKAYKIIN